MSELYKRWNYPGGEVGVRINSPKPNFFRLQSSDDLIAMLMTLDAYYRRTDEHITEITIPYLPYARQDRVATIGDPLAISVLARIIGTSGVKVVKSLDVHSDASRATFFNSGIELQSMSPSLFIDAYLLHISAKKSKVALVSPDKGAINKTKMYLKDLEITNSIFCEKKRNPDTGALDGFNLFETNVQDFKSPEDLTDLVIVDDICDGGGTFLGIADVLRKVYPKGKYKLHLWTSHGIYSRGLEVLAEKFDTIGSTNSFDHGIDHPNLYTIYAFAD